jgi:hypothetical protein
MAAYTRRVQVTTIKVANYAKFILWKCRSLV